MSRFGKLICLNGPRLGQEYGLNREITRIGRAVDSDIMLEDQFASRNHAEVRRIESAYQVADLGSKNGIYVNGQQLSAGSTAWLQQAKLPFQRAVEYDDKPVTCR